jgi:type II secretory pathway component PulJ
MGFSTILDVLGATIIGGLLLLVLLRVNANATENKIINGSDKILQRDLVDLALTLENDLRKMGYCADPSKLTESMSRIIYANSSQISYYTDVDRDGNLDSILYFISDTTALLHTTNPRDRILYRKVNNQLPLIVSTNIVEFNLNYFDALGKALTSPVASPSLIAHMEISFKVEDSEAYDQKYSEAYWQQVRLSSKNLNKR